MERESVLKAGKYMSILVMLLTGVSVGIAGATGYLNTQEWGSLVIALGVFIVALRGYLKDKYGVV